jgi:signal transduction histidine kinase
MDPILIVDDEKDILEALRRMLRGVYEVEIAESPFEALKRVQSRVYHVIVSDQRMPEMTGVEFLEKVKKLSPLSTRVLLTGYTDIESVIDSINRGNIYRYVSKPWEPEELKITLNQANEAFRLKKELEEKNRNLEKAYQELTLLDKAKSKFLTLVSHELNTPLTILNSFVELISERTSELPADFSKAFLSIQGATHRLSDIVTEVVDYVRLESKVEMNKTEVDLSLLLRELISESDNRALKKKLSVKLTTPESVKLFLDLEKINIGLRCLIQDAMSRAPENTEVNIKLEKTPQVVRLSVERSGPPLSEEAFFAFETGQPLMNHQKNLGLELATCRLVLERHSASFRSFTRDSKSIIEIDLGLSF